MTYVHGYSERETQRLLEQALILENLLHTGTVYPACSHILEVGCGVGAQTRILARRNPDVRLTSIDISPDSVEKAKVVLQGMGIKHVNILQTDILNHPFEPGMFDHIFVCFVLEHLNDPVAALSMMKDLLRPEGTITIIEGDHGSGFWTPESKASRSAWSGLIKSQINLGHDPNIGRRLYPILKESGLSVVEVSPRAVYADQSNHELLNGVVNQIITPMVYSAEKQVIEENLLEIDEWKKGLADISRVADLEDGSFFYTWFKGVGTKV